MSGFEQLCGYGVCLGIICIVGAVFFIVICAVGSGVDAHMQE